ncbi:MAG: 4-hydroxy-tetrahydrodipicolinate synthase [Gemmatimonadetes bacterium]|nr:4-hydroxy-tetrahydrodipicolinate synthase [Gemmatimonadota bacterium]
MKPTSPAGLSVAVVTPMHADGSLDLAALRHHVLWLIDGGVDTLMPSGSTGESATLDDEEQRQVIATCVEAAEGRVPVFAGAGSSSTKRSTSLARAARQEGASGLLVVTPYYNKPSQDGLRRHFTEVTEAGEGLPVVLYNVPSRTGVNLLPETVFRLAELEPVVGVKEASGDLDQVMTLIRGRPDGFLVLSGDDGLGLAIMALGGDGVVSVAANEIPDRMKELVTAALSNDIGRARALHYELLPLLTANFIESNPVPVKTALHLMGHMGPHVRGPLVPLSPGSLATLRKVLLEAGLLPGGS